MKERKKLQINLSISQEIFDEPDLTQTRFSYAKKQCAELRRQIRMHQENYICSRNDAMNKGK